MIPNGTPILASRNNHSNNKNQAKINNNNNNTLKTCPPSPSPTKRSDPLNSLSVAAAAAASTLRHSFNVTTGHHNNNYNLNHHQSQTAVPLADKLKGSFKGRGRHAAGLPQRGSNASTAAGNENCSGVNNHGRFQRTLSLDGSSGDPQLMLTGVQEETDKKPAGQQMPQEVVTGIKNGGGGGGGGKSRRMMFGGSKFSQNSLSFDVRDSNAYHNQRHKEDRTGGVRESPTSHLHKSHSAEIDSACEDTEHEEDEDGVVLRKKKPPLPMDFDSDDNYHSGSEKIQTAATNASQTGILSTLISTSQRNSQLRSTLSKARHHLSFEKWRSSSIHSTSSASAGPQSTPNSNNHNHHHHNNNPQDCTSANQANNSSNNSVSSNNSSSHNHSANNITPPTPSESPGGRLSRWFSIRRGSSHHYDLNGGASGAGARTGSASSGGDGVSGMSGRDVRDGGGGGSGSAGGSSRLNSINNEHELAQQIQQQLHQSLSKVISQSNALQQLQQQSAEVTCCARPLSSHNGCGSDNSKMPLVAEGNEREESYSTFGRGMSYRTTSTLKSAAAINASQMLTPMPPVPPAGLTQQQLKRRHIVAAIAHSEISYVATLSRLVNVSMKMCDGVFRLCTLSRTTNGKVNLCPAPATSVIIILYLSLVVCSVSSIRWLV